MADYAARVPPLSRPTRSCHWRDFGCAAPQLKIDILSQRQPARLFVSKSTVLFCRRGGETLRIGIGTSTIRPTGSPRLQIVRLEREFAMWVRTILIAGLATLPICAANAQSPAKPDDAAKKTEYESKTTSTICSIDVSVGSGTPRSRARATISVEIDPEKYVFGVRGNAADNVSGYNYPFPSCSQGGECAIGWSRFVGDWSSRYTGNKRTIFWVFENWKHDRTRTAYICVTTN